VIARLRVPLVAACVILVGAYPAGGEPPRPTPAEIGRLIRQLGSESFQEREAASRALELIGEPALGALAKAADNADAEIRGRAARLVEVLRPRLAARAWAAVTGLGGEVLDAEDGSGRRSVAVDLSGTRADDVDIDHLKWLASPDSLDLSGTRVTDAGLPGVGVLTNLRTLSLTGTAVTDAGLVHLRGLRRLRVLGLVGTKVRGRGLAHLQGLGDLRCLVLSSTPVTDAGLAPLGGWAGSRCWP
jgi:hypothetical protein